MAERQLPRGMVSPVVSPTPRIATTPPIGTPDWKLAPFWNTTVEGSSPGGRAVSVKVADWPLAEATIAIWLGLAGAVKLAKAMPCALVVLAVEAGLAPPLVTMKLTEMPDRPLPEESVTSTISGWKACPTATLCPSPEILTRPPRLGLRGQVKVAETEVPTTVICTTTGPGERQNDPVEACPLESVVELGVVRVADPVVTVQCTLTLGIGTPVWSYTTAISGESVWPSSPDWPSPETTTAVVATRDALIQGFSAG